MDAHIWLALTVSFSGGLGLGCLLAAASRRDDSTAAHCVDPEVVLESRLDAYAQGYEDGIQREEEAARKQEAALRYNRGAIEDALCVMESFSWKELIEWLMEYEGKWRSGANRYHTFANQQALKQLIETKFSGEEHVESLLCNIRNGASLSGAMSTIKCSFALEDFVNEQVEERGYGAAMRFTQAFRDTTFALGGGKKATWGEATVDQHDQRITYMRKRSQATLEDVILHEQIKGALIAAGVECLNELPAPMEEP